MVVSANPPPTLGTYAAATVAAVDSIVVSPTLPPADPNGNLLSVVVDPTGLPATGSLTIDSTSGAITVDTFIDTVEGDYPVSVTATDRCGAVTTETFLLTVAPCQLPPAASTPIPTDLAVDESLDVQLSWNPGPTAPVHCARSFDVYLDTVSPPATLLASGLTSPTVSTGPLSEVTPYYWQVVTIDCCGETSGPVWTFATLGVARLTVAPATLEFLLAPGAATNSQLLITNVGTGSADWRLADLPTPAGAAAAAGDSFVSPDPGTLQQGAVNWQVPHEPNSLIVTFRRPTPIRGASSSSTRNRMEKERTKTTQERVHSACGQQLLIRAARFRWTLFNFQREAT